MLGLGESELQLFGQRPGEVVSAQRDAPLPNAVPVGHHQVGGVGAHAKNDVRGGWILGIVFVGGGQIVELIEGEEVIQSQGRQLYEVDVEPCPGERLQRPKHLVPLHREDAHFGFQDKAFHFHPAGDLLVVPDHVVQVEGDLLPGLVLDDVRDPLGLDRRQLDEPGQAALARHRNGHPIAANTVPRLELRQGVADQLLRVGARLGENLGILDVVERLGDDLIRVTVQTASHRLQRRIADVNSPDRFDFGHGTDPLSVPGGAEV